MILDMAKDQQIWKEFLQYKIDNQHLSKKRQKEYLTYIDNQRYIHIIQAIESGRYDIPVPVKKTINKVDGRKRVIYTFDNDFNILLKMIAYLLRQYDYVFAENCYAFRCKMGVGDAIRRLKAIKDIDKKYCMKLDIKNYFNSIDAERLIEKLAFLKVCDEDLYALFINILTVDKAYDKDRFICEKRGAMAGVPVSPFWANVYLMELDRQFAQTGITYFRYSDDILLFADSMKQLETYAEFLKEYLTREKLEINKEKTRYIMPGEPVEFLGFSYCNGIFDISESTKKKMKGKIKRKAAALVRWSDKKGLSGEKAAKGFIKAMNKKLYESSDENDFCWSKWFFPYISTDQSIHELDRYMQQYVRYCVTGRHAKINYKISYETMKEWGYRSLVNEYYKKHGKEK